MSRPRRMSSRPSTITIQGPSYAPHHAARSPQSSLCGAHMRAWQLFLPNLRQPPADAEAVSHKLLVRGAFIRQVSAGIWTFLPLGWRVHEKIVQINREEMDALRAQ